MIINCIKHTMILSHLLIQIANNKFIHRSPIHYRLMKNPKKILIILRKKINNFRILQKNF